MPRLPDFRTRLAKVSENPSTADLQPFADELAQRCAAERYPLKSVAAVLRHARAVVPEATVSLLSELVQHALTDSRGEVPHEEPPLEPFLGIGEASRRLAISPKTLHERLREVRYRRLYGWAWWDGHQWCFSPAAIDPLLRAQYMAALPDTEPNAHAAMLPPWCDRHPAEL